MKLCYTQNCEKNKEIRSILQFKILYLFTTRYAVFISMALEEQQEESSDTKNENYLPERKSKGEGWRILPVTHLY